jgi:peptide/nickel transport system substrate-binding protein
MRRIVCSILILAATVLSACGGASTPTVAPTTGPTQAPPTATAVPPTPTAKAPQVGGNLVFALGEPETLDPQATVSEGMQTMMRYIGGTVLSKDPKTDAYIPYLAESYKISADYLTWEIVFRKGMKWHDGTPFTAKDYEYTLARVQTIASTATASLIRGMEKAIAIDDYTIRLTFTEPNFSLLDGLTSAFMTPLPQAYVERVGQDYGRKPIGLGPFKFKEWITGYRVVVERNPDFTWGPAFSRGGAPYLQTITFRLISEYDTVVAGLESGEIGIAKIQTKDLERLTGTGQFQFLETLYQGAGPWIVFNVERPPLDDVRIRQALNYAVDRKALLKVVGYGQGEVTYGPLSPAVRGYWPGVEKIGYGYDPDKAKALFKEAGYTTGADGMLQKDGKPLKIKLSVYPAHQKVAEPLQQQFKELGVGIELHVNEGAALSAQVREGTTEMVVDYWPWPDSTILYALFHSKLIGVLNLGRVKADDVDKLCNDINTLTDDKARQASTDALQKLIVERAYVAPLYALKTFTAVNKQVHGIIHSSISGYNDFFDAWMD